MRHTRIYTDQPLSEHCDIELGKDAARHLVSALRMKVGDQVSLFNGKGGEYFGNIVGATSKSVLIRTEQYLVGDSESPLRTLLGISISRGDRFDWVLQKATELGVSEIFPLYTERTEVKLKSDREEKKLRHWQQVIASACEQCGRNILPQLHRPQKFSDWLDIDTDLKLLLHHRSDINLQSMATLKPLSVALAIGPEGGLSAEEIKLGLHSGFQSLALGPRILRTETAPIAILSLLQGLWGDF